MNKMSFDTFIWPVNPAQYREFYSREPVYKKDQMGNITFSGMSPAHRRMSGEGIFSGPGAYENFRKLKAMMQHTSPKKLTHPVWGSCSAYLTELNSLQQPREDYVSYSFVFREADASGAIPG